MPTSLDLRRGGLTVPEPSLLARVRSRAPGWLWRAMNPLTREAFAEAPAPAPLRRLEVATRDGWQLSVGTLERRPGGSGEPVVIWPTLGASGDLYRYGAGRTLASRLVEAGFSVYLGAHRLGEDATPGERSPPPAFDDAAWLDVSAVVDAVAEHSGYPRVHLVGHGLGGQLALAWAARTAGGRLASLAVMSSPVRFPVDARAWGQALTAVAWLPPSWSLPARRTARWSAATAPGARRRGGLVHGAADVPLGAARDLASWLRAGALVDRSGGLDYAHGLSRVREPLWLGIAPGDALCRPSWALPLRDVWRGGPVRVSRLPAAFDHLDLVLHPDAGDSVHGPLVAWLGSQRVRAWRRDVHDLGHRSR